MPPPDLEEAATVDGATRLQILTGIIAPLLLPGIVVTTMFAFITAWNEYAFSLILTDRVAMTAPPFISSRIGSGGVDWGWIAAGTVLFVLPVAVFTFLMRRHLLRGVTFGAIKK